MSAVQSVRVTEFDRSEATRMQGQVKEDWMQLCEQIAVEKDTERLIKLARELNRMLCEKEERLERERSARGGI